ncbi:MAG: hypothetical protein JRN11_05470 [Nitrososphaerota archaeon]|nr:hypothetical protein [Nitrososphaerota archaeon]MDG7026180.1 hypothetical protein [Nitrososphaerota archaeon]
MKASIAFVFLSLVGVAEAFVHAWQENAFTTYWTQVRFSSYASLLGVPYWAFGIVWFPLVLVVGLWVTRFGRDSLRRELMVLLTVGNIFTGYLWFLDLVVVRAFSAEYVGLYVTNYALTGLVIAQNWSSVVVKDFSAGTIIGVVVGVFFGPFATVAFGLAGGLLGAFSGYTSTR